MKKNCQICRAILQTSNKSQKYCGSVKEQGSCAWQAQKKKVLNNHQRRRETKPKTDHGEWLDVNCNYSL